MLLGQPAKGGEHPVDEDGPEDHLPHRAGGVLGDGVDVDPGHTQDPFRVGAHASLVDPGYSSRSRRTTPGTHTWAAELKEAPPRAPHPLSLSPFETAAGGLLRERRSDRSLRSSLCERLEERTVGDRLVGRCHGDQVMPQMTTRAATAAELII